MRPETRCLMNAIQRCAMFAAATLLCVDATFADPVVRDAGSKIRGDFGQSGTTRSYATTPRYFAPSTTNTTTVAPMVVQAPVTSLAPRAAQAPTASPNAMAQADGTATRRGTRTLSIEPGADQ